MRRLHLPSLRIPRLAENAVETGRIAWATLLAPPIHFKDAGMPLPGWCGLGWKESANAAVTITAVRADRDAVLHLDREPAVAFAAAMQPAVVELDFRIEQECESWPSRAETSTRTFEGTLRLETASLRVHAGVAEGSVLRDVVLESEFGAWRAVLSVEGLDRIRLGLVNTLLAAERIRETAATRLLTLLAA